MIARRVVTLRLHEAIETFLLLRGLPVDGYVLIGHAARWVKGEENVLGVVSLYVPGISCTELTDLYGFRLEALGAQTGLHSKYATRTVRDGLNVEA